MRADLSFSQSPPFSVPARFLLTAPAFGLAAALVMLWAGPAMIDHRWTPELLAVTHLLTLGFLAMAMLGAMMQLLPVLMAVSLPSPLLFSALVHVALVTGTTCLGLAWLLNAPSLFTVAIFLLGTVLTVFVMTAIQRLLRSRSCHATHRMMILASIGLLLTAALGIYLAMGHAWAGVVLQRQLTDLHLGWGLFGWVLMLVIAVAYQVIPMFQITDEYPAIHQRWMGWILFSGLLLFSLSVLAPIEALLQPAKLLLSGCVLGFAFTTLRVLHNRRRNLPDITLNFWRLSMASLVALCMTWYCSLLLERELPVLLGVLMIHGFAMSAVNGMMYKIIPFITWLHLSAVNKNLRDSGKREAQIKVPHMRNVIPEKPGQWQFRAHLLSLLLLAGAAAWPQWLFYPAALVFAVAQSGLLLLLVKATLLYRRTCILQDAAR